MKIIIDRNIPYIREVLEPCADVLYLPGGEIRAEDVKGAGALLIRTRTTCNEALLKGSAVRFIGTATIGTDHIDMDYCRQNGITVENAAGCNAGAVMQYITAALLHLSGQKGKNLHKMTLGIVGVGNVGRLVDKAARALGMRTLLNDPPRAAREGSAGFTDLEKVLEQADVLTLHVPLTTSTFRMAGESFFRKMKEGAWFLNTSRGEVVDEQALVKCHAKMGAIVLDVWQHEPDINKQLLAVAGIATPHIAGYSLQGKANATKMIIRSLARFFEWEKLLYFEPDTGVIPEIREVKKEDTLSSFVCNIYDITSDDTLLRKNPALFENIRNEYTLRNEFDACRVKGDGKIIPVLKALGFTLLI